MILLAFALSSACNLLRVGLFSFNWQTGLRVVCHGVSWLTAPPCNHITLSAKDPHPNLSLKWH